MPRPSSPTDVVRRLISDWKRELRTYRRELDAAPKKLQRALDRLDFAEALRVSAGAHVAGLALAHLEKRIRELEEQLRGLLWAAQG
jgi:polyhydroxyalkanoate synthesis regulator phasin